MVNALCYSGVSRSGAIYIINDIAYNSGGNFWIEVRNDDIDVRFEFDRSVMAIYEQYKLHSESVLNEISDMEDIVESWKFVRDRKIDKSYFVDACRSKIIPKINSYNTKFLGNVIKVSFWWSKVDIYVKMSKKQGVWVQD